MVELTSGRGGRTGGFCTLPLVFLLCACAGDGMFSFAGPPSTASGGGAGLSLAEYVPMARVSYFGHDIAGNVPENAPGFNKSRPEVNCSFGDRFDRKTTLAYNFDNAHQLAFKLGINPSEGGPAGISHAGIAFRWRFNSVKSPVEAPPKERCLYDSHWQGLGGSIYNELFLRQNNNVWGIARDHGLDFWH